MATDNAISRSSWWTWALPLALVLAACLFNLVAYLPELVQAAPDINDHVFHFGLVQRMNEAWEAGENPLDPWIPYWGQGFPVLRYYQHLPHLSVVLIHRALLGSVPLHVVFEAFHLTLLVLLPGSFYLGGRLLGFDRLTSALVAVCVPLLGAASGERHFLGFQPGSFIWTGSGLFTQLAAMVLFPLAVGLIHRSSLHGRRFGPALAALAGTWLSHLVLGYTACLLGLLVFLRPDAGGRRKAIAVRLAALYLTAAAVIAYLILPSLLESDLLSRSVWEAPEYWDSYGMRHVLVALFEGALLDGARIPVLSLLAAAGILSATLLIARRDSRSGPVVFAVAAFVLSLLLFFGRPTWGWVLRLLPFSDNLPLHRFICAVQYSGLLLAGLGLAWIWRLARWRSGLTRSALALVVTLVTLAPAAMSTWDTANESTHAQTRSAVEMESSGADFRETLEEIAALDAQHAGRAYGGTSWDWGQSYRVAGVTAYSFWTEYGLAAISYMYHTMGLNSDLEVDFDPRRRDHYELYNVRYLIAHDRAVQPGFSTVIASRPGISAAMVDTEGYFAVVGVDWYFDAHDASQRDLYELNRQFIAGPWHARRRFVRIGWRSSDGPGENETEITTELPSGSRAMDDWAAPDGRVTSYWRRGEEYGATIETEGPAYVLFRMTYHPGWRVTVDGSPTETVMLSPSYIGVRVSPGEHTIVARYTSSGWTVALFWIGLVLIVLVFLADAFKLWPSARF